MINISCLNQSMTHRIKNELYSSAGGGKDLRISFTDQVPCAFWLLLHSDLHEIRITSVLEDMPSMLANINPMTQTTYGQRSNSELCLLRQNSEGSFIFT